MVKYIIKRILMMVLVVLGVALFVFIISRASGDPIPMLLGENYTQADYDALYIEMGFDKPYIVQFFNYLKDVFLEFDLGISYENKVPVMEEIMNRFPTSLRLALVALIASVPLGVLIGMICALKQNTWIDYTLNTVSSILIAIPTFWVAILLMLVISLKFKLLPATGLVDWKSYILPAIALGLHPMAMNARLTRTSMLEVIRADYVRTARSKGCNERMVIFRHALRNAALPIVTQIGMNVTVVVGSSAVVEGLFGFPGLGSFIISSIGARDYPCVQGAILVFSIFVCVVNLVVDIVYGFIDPRIRAKHVSTGAAFLKLPKKTKGA